MRFLMKCCIKYVNFIRLLLLSTELCKFEIQKCGQIFCVHSPIFSCRVTYSDMLKLHLILGIHRYCMAFSINLQFLHFTLNRMITQNNSLGVGESQVATGPTGRNKAECHVFLNHVVFHESIYYKGMT